MLPDPDLDDLGRQHGDGTDEEPERHGQDPHPADDSQASESGERAASESME